MMVVNTIEKYRQLAICNKMYFNKVSSLVFYIHYNLMHSMEHVK